MEEVVDIVEENIFVKTSIVWSVTKKHLHSFPQRSQSVGLKKTKKDRIGCLIHLTICFCLIVKNVITSMTCVRMMQKIQMDSDVRTVQITDYAQIQKIVILAIPKVLGRSTPKRWRVGQRRTSGLPVNISCTRTRRSYLIATLVRKSLELCCIVLRIDYSGVEGVVKVEIRIWKSFLMF